MAVQKRDDEPARRARAALFKADELAGHQAGLERAVALMLFLASLAGSVLAGGGGAASWAAGAASWPGATAALAGQLLLSYVQYVYAGRSWAAWPYRHAVYLSSFLTTWGYLPLAVPPLAGAIQLASVPELTAYLLAGLALVIAAVAADVFPERTLVER